MSFEAYKPFTIHCEDEEGLRHVRGYVSLINMACGLVRVRESGLKVVKVVMDNRIFSEAEIDWLSRLGVKSARAA